MRPLRLATLLFGLLLSAVLLTCGAIIAVAGQYVGGAFWVAVFLYWLAMWGSR